MIYAECQVSSNMCAGKGQEHRYSLVCLTDGVATHTMFYLLKNGLGGITEFVKSHRMFKNRVLCIILTSHHLQGWENSQNYLHCIPRRNQNSLIDVILV